LLPFSALCFGVVSIATALWSRHGVESLPWRALESLGSAYERKKGFRPLR
jgi:hypothetical protein